MATMTKAKALLIVRELDKNGVALRIKQSDPNYRCHVVVKVDGQVVGGTGRDWAQAVGMMLDTLKMKNLDRKVADRKKAE